MKHLRNLETMMDAQKALNKLRRSEVRFNLISAGSVFYGNAPSMAKSESLCATLGKPVFRQATFARCLKN